MNQVSTSSTNSLSFLIEYQAPQRQELLRAFNLAVQNNDLPTMKSIHDQNLKKCLLSNLTFDLVNEPCPERSAVHNAIHSGYDKVLMWLLNEGGDLRATTLDGWDCLTLAVDSGHLNIVHIIISQLDVDPNYVSIRGTALHIAARKDDERLVKALLQHPGIRTYTLYENRTPEDIAGKRTKILLAEERNRQPQIDSFRSSVTKFIHMTHLSENSLLFNAPQRPPIVTGKVQKLNYCKLFHYERILVIDPESGFLARYSDDYDVPFSPIELIPLESINQVELSTGHWYYRSHLHYVSVQYSNHTMIFGVRFLSVAQRWVDIFQKCIGYVKYINSKINSYNVEGEFTKIHQAVAAQLMAEANKEIMIVDQPTLDQQKYLDNKRVQVGLNYKESLDQIPEMSIYENDQIGTENISLQGLNVFECIGKGSFGCVYKVEYNGKLYALKQQEKFKLISTNNLKYALSEASILKQIYHPFLVNCVSCFQTNGNLYILMEYCEGGDLSQYMTRGVIWPAIQAKLYIAEIILAIEYLHSKNIIYRDLKPENIAIDSTGHIKLLDFGLSKEGQTGEVIAESFCGSPAYLSPELVNCVGSTKQTDIYGIGALLYEMLTGYPPHYNQNIEKLLYDIKFKAVFIPQYFERDIKDLIQQLLSKKPENRPSISQIKKHQFFADIDWAKVLKKLYKPAKLNVKFPPNKNIFGVAFIDEESSDMSNMVMNWNFNR